MKKLLRILRTAAPFLLLTLVFVGIDAYRTRQVIVEPARLAPVTTLAGTTRDLIELSRTRPVLIYFWATWCGPCKATSPGVNWLAGRYDVISVALDSGPEADIAAYLNEAGYAFPVVNDQGRRLADAFGVKATPTIVVLKDGRVSSATVGISTPVGLWLRLILA